MSHKSFLENNLYKAQIPALLGRNYSSEHSRNQAASVQCWVSRPAQGEQDQRENS